LEPALWTGISFAQQLSSRMNADQQNPRRSANQPQLVGVNHLEGHLYSFLLAKSHSNVLENIRMRKLFPAVALIASGGHTILLLVRDLAHWKKLGETQDDAVGEAFDKVARLLGLPYPGGPALEKLALSLPKGQRPSIAFPRPMLNQKNYNFSFSGLKTAVLYYLREHGAQMNADNNPSARLGTGADKRGLSAISVHPRSNPRESATAADIAASFQAAAIDVLVKKTMRAAEELSAKGGSASGGGAPIKSILLSGGVAANKELQRQLRHASSVKGMQFLVPPFKYNTDNAVIMAVAAYMTHLRKKRYKLEAQGNLGI
jgi:N6-L-threonylcarbamoyladenine synthase